MMSCESFSFSVGIWCGVSTDRTADGAQVVPDSLKGSTIRKAITKLRLVLRWCLLCIRVTRCDYCHIEVLDIHTVATPIRACGSGLLSHQSLLQKRKIGEKFSLVDKTNDPAAYLSSSSPAPDTYVWTVLKCTPTFFAYNRLLIYTCLSNLRIKECIRVLRYVVFLRSSDSSTIK